MAKLTELESCTLGVIRELAPCSAYEVRVAFSRSPTTEWSASAGSIYPVIARLERMKLVRATSRRGDSRRRRDLALTRAGERVLRAWVASVEPELASSVPDPIRSRVHFSVVLGRKEQLAMLQRAEALTVAAIRNMRPFLVEERKTSKLDYLASLGGLYQLQARLAWLRKLQRTL